jgi:hypothetical protein
MGRPALLAPGLGTSTRARALPILHSHVTERVPLSAVFPQGWHCVPKVRAFLEFLVGRFSHAPLAQNLLLANSVDEFSKGSVWRSHPWPLTVSSSLDS